MNSTQFEEGFGGMAVRIRGLDRLLQTMIAKGHSKRMWTMVSMLVW